MFLNNTDGKAIENRTSGGLGGYWDTLYLVTRSKWGSGAKFTFEWRREEALYHLIKFVSVAVIQKMIA